MLPHPGYQVDNQPLSLRELNFRVKAAIQGAMPGAFWLRAETSDVRVNHSSGHCYLEFVEKNPKTGQIVAKARASIWAKTVALLIPFFEKETGQAFVSGLTVLVKVTVEFHELYGFSLTVCDIDPSYTLGDMVRKRMEIIKQLQEDGVFTLNKELVFPSLPRRIAVITSPSAAGYEDFMNQLEHNAAGYPFYVKLFSAIMQGDRTEESVMAALDRVYSYADIFDVVAIIRGGGATSDLSCFDSYLLAANCAQFPLPIITGIGHERDETILDQVAHSRMKTPTAVAEFLISRMDLAATVVDELQMTVTSCTDKLLAGQKSTIQMLVSKLPVMTLNRMEKARSSIQSLGSKLSASARSLITRRESAAIETHRKMQHLISERLAENERFLQLTEQFVRMASPEYILKRGYTLTLKDGKIVKSASSFAIGERIVTRFSDGEVEGTVASVTKQNKKDETK